jgi:hypothetical protein
MGNVRVRGSYIHGNKRGIFWNEERDDIFIKPADKGSAVVVMDKTTYLQEAETTVRLSILRKIRL